MHLKLQVVNDRQTLVRLLTRGYILRRMAQDTPLKIWA